MNTDNNRNDTLQKSDGYTTTCIEQEPSNLKERLNLSLPKNLMNYLREDAENNYKSITCVIIEILNFNKFIIDAVKKGYKLALEDSNGKIHYVMFGNMRPQLI